MIAKLRVGETAYCAVCHRPYRMPKSGHLRCGRAECVKIYSERVAAQAPALAKPRSSWPAAMAIEKPFANDIREPRFSPPRMSGGASLAGGCSSSAGWDVVTGE